MNDNETPARWQVALAGIIASLVLVALIYAMIAFINIDTDFRTWGVFGRSVFVAASLGAIFLVIDALADNEDDDADED